MTDLRLPASRVLPEGAFWLGARWREARGAARGRVVEIVGGAPGDRVVVATVVALTAEARRRAARGERRAIAKRRLVQRFDLVLEGTTDPGAEADDDEIPALRWDTDT